MAATSSFDWLCEELEAATSLDRLEARGTVRLALKESGLDVKSCTTAQLLVVVERVLPEELRRRGVETAEAVCQGLGSGLKTSGTEGGGADTPESVFARLGSR